MRMHALPLLAAFLLGLAAAALVACGSDGRIPAGDASQLRSQLDRVSADFKAGECDAAQSAVVRARSIAVSLPPSVDRDLAARLRSGLASLQSRVSATCGQTQTTTQTQTQAPDTSSTQTTTSETTTSTDTATTTTGTGTTGTGTTGTGTTGTGTSSTPSTTPGTTPTTGGTPPGTTP
jgi:hypothetical protein